MGSLWAPLARYYYYYSSNKIFSLSVLGIPAFTSLPQMRQRVWGRLDEPQFLIVKMSKMGVNIQQIHYPDSKSTATNHIDGDALVSKVLVFVCLDKKCSTDCNFHTENSPFRSLIAWGHMTMHHAKNPLVQLP